MGFRPGDEDGAAFAEASLRSLEQGGLPLAAQARLRALREGGGFFTSDLSTSEYLLARGARLRPLTQVMGSCFYHVGWQGLPIAGGYASPVGDPFLGWQGAGGWQQGQTFELATATEAWNEARRLALGRLAEEARLAGADGVVGVRLESGRYEWASSLIEVVVVGTAVAGAGAGDGEPRLSNLSGQEFAALREAGWAPAGLVAATSVCFVVTGWKQQQASSWLGTAWQNQELPDFTRGVAEARTQAMLRLRRQSGELGAQGVVGVSLDVAVEEHEANGVTNLVVTVHVIGTAVVERERRDPTVYIALPLT